MKTDFKAKWVKALRSGDYDQATGSLRLKEDTHEFSYCCLGVLCDVAGADWSGDIPKIDGEFLEDRDESLLSGNALDFFGLDQKTQHHLAELNDGNTDKAIHNHSFSEIADYIEKNL